MADVPVVEKHTDRVVSKYVSWRGTKLGSHTQLQKATKNPNQANVKTRPYTLIGLNAGIERAFLLTGLTTGALHKVVTSNIAVASETRFEGLAIERLP